MKTTKRDKALELLRQAHQASDPRYAPQCPPDNEPTGWLTGLQLILRGAGSRYGARIHELRHRYGYDIQCHIEHRDGDAIPFYKLVSDGQQDAR